MLSEFRVSELKDVLRKASQSQRGKKADLFQRASELLRHGSPKVQLQIREIYRNTGRPYHRAIKQASPAKAKLKKAQQMVSQQRQNKVPYVVHPDVKFKPHPFFKLRTVIIRPTALGKKYLLCVYVCVRVWALIICFEHVYTSFNLYCILIL